jgi:hypothetical protein
MADVRDFENEIRAERNTFLAAEAGGFCHGIFSGTELATLVELTVVGKIGLDGYPDDPSPVQDDPAIEETGIDLKRGAYDEDQVEGGRLASDLFDSTEDTTEKRLLVEEVIVGIGGEAQFRKEGKHGMTRRSLPGEENGLIGIEPGIGDLYRGDTDRGPDEAMVVEIEEFIGIIRFHGYSFSIYA